MKTVLAWLVANIETALSVVLIAVFVPLFMSQMDLSAYTSAQRWGFALVLAFMVILPVSVTSKNFLSSFIFFLVAAACYVYAITHLGDVLTVSTGYNQVKAILWTGGIVSLVLSVIIGIFTAVNMDEVVSLRMLYVNSDVSMFDMTIKYSLNRAMTTFGYLSWAVFCTAAYIVFRQLLPLM